jgi:hypothetical protein
VVVVVVVVVVFGVNPPPPLPPPPLPPPEGLTGWPVLRSIQMPNSHTCPVPHEVPAQRYFLSKMPLQKSQRSVEVKLPYLWKGGEGGDGD